MEGKGTNMSKLHRIFLYGNSVILGTMGVSLRRCPGYEVTTLSPPWPDRDALHALEPDVILFDAEADRPQAAFSLLEVSPGLLLIALNPDGNIVKMWSGRQLRQPSTQDLLGVINAQLSDSDAI
jgi:hypothetical protein